MERKRLFFNAGSVKEGMKKKQMGIYELDVRECVRTKR